MRRCVDYNRTNAVSFRKLTGRIRTVLLAALMLLAIWIFAERVYGENPSILGYRMLRVATGSMEPDYKVGDVILIRKVSLEELAVGDDITYLSKSGETAGILVTHRIIAIEKDIGSGTWTIRTEGIAAGAAPDAPITGEQVYGRVLRVCSALTVVYTIFLTKPGLIVCLLPLFLMMAAEIANLIAIIGEGDAQDAKTEENDGKD